MPSPVFSIVSILVLLLSISSLFSVVSPVRAVDDKVEWSRVNIPSGGQAGNWALAGGSNVKHLTQTADGTFYAYANPSATAYTLFKSTNSGFSWSYTGDVRDTIVDIAAVPGDTGAIYYATASRVYKSGDAGKSFIELPPNPGGAGSDNITIATLDVSRLDGHNIIAVGTRDSESGQYGGVYTLDENELLPDWVDTNVGSYDVSDAAFSPNFAADRQLVAVVTDEQDTFVTSRIGSGDWDQIIGRAVIEGISASAAVIGFPDDYDATEEGSTLFVSIDTGSGDGDVYKVYEVWAPGDSPTIDLDIGDAYNMSSIDVAALTISGNAIAISLMAGAADSAQVYTSRDGGTNWTKSVKPPTGQSITGLVMATDFAASGKAYAATSGTESAFSYTADGGATWNQASLIDTEISSNSIVDLTVSPGKGQDDVLFMITFDSTHTEHSLWRSLNGGGRWERVFAGVLSNVDTISMVEVSPAYNDSSKVVFLVGTAKGGTAVWRSEDNGQTFSYRGVPFSIDVLTALGDNSLFAGSYNGTSGLVHHSSNGGLSYSDGVETGSQPLKSIALSPNYEQDGAILASNTNGWVYYSDDKGASFNPLPPDAASPPLTGSVTVAFDSEFAANNTVYAASDTANKGVYRFVVNQSTDWERIDTTLPSGGTINQIAVSSDGTLYAVNSQSADAAAGKGGIERSLNPTYSSGPTFETVPLGLNDGVNLSGLWLRGNQLWAIDTANTRLMTFVDRLAQPVILTSPPDKVAVAGIENIILKWEELSGATEYEWQLDYDTDFSSVPTDFEDTTKATSARLPELDTDTVYHWRVRATEPLLSLWSDEWYFTTGLGSSVNAPELYSPKAGATDVSLKPLFQWSAIAGADSYEIIVSTDFAFGNPTILKIGDFSLPATAWQSTTSLDYDTTYYWKVRANGQDSHSAWSAVGAFTTGSPPSQASPVTAPASAPSEQSLVPSELPSVPTESSPSPIPPSSSPPPAQPVSPQAVFPDWAIYLFGALLLTIIILLITLLVLVVTIRRS